MTHDTITTVKHTFIFIFMPLALAHVGVGACARSPLGTTRTQNINILFCIDVTGPGHPSR
jgi:hypothetical protein